MPVVLYSVYSGRSLQKASALGNVRLGEGYGYREDGVLQTTGDANYGSMGEKVRVDFYAETCFAQMGRRS